MPKPRANPGASRPALSAGLIEATALELIEVEGTDFSMRRLAAALNCSPMSLYHYYPSKGHLMDALIDRIFAGLMPLPEGKSWRARMEATIAAWRETVRARPGMLVFLITHRLNTPTALAWLDTVMALVREATHDEAEAARRFRLLGYYLTGAVLDECAGYTRGPSTVTPVPPEEMAARFPNVTAAAPSFAPEARERIYADGLALILDAFDPARGAAPARDTAG